jgi:hypothetical protein
LNESGNTTTRSATTECGNMGEHNDNHALNAANLNNNATITTTVTVDGARGAGVPLTLTVCSCGDHARVLYPVGPSRLSNAVEDAIEGAGWIIEHGDDPFVVFYDESGQQVTEEGIPVHFVGQAVRRPATRGTFAYCGLPAFQPSS